MKPDERALLELVRAGTSPRDAGHSLSMPHKRIEYLCHKWSRKGWYDWGVVHDLGWLTPEGKEGIE